MHLVHRNTCRACGSSALTRVIDLGEQYLQGSFVKPGKEIPSTRKIPTALVRCDPTKDQNACGLLQMEHTVPPDILYAAYWYRSGTNATMRTHLQGIVREALAILKSPRGNVLDIGCNDGTLLAAYPRTFRKFGVDPSDVAREIKGAVTVVQDTFPSEELMHRLGKLRCDVITSIAMFYDLEDPIAFARAIQRILSPRGIWIFEMSYMPTMLRLNLYDTICHEHLEYYSLAVIEYILQRAGMKVFKLSLNTINGGSIRCFATHSGNFRYASAENSADINSMRRNEFDLELDTDKPYRLFQERANAHRDNLRSLLLQLKKEGKRIHVYGASTKGNTILQWCGINSGMIDVAAERNPDKYGAHTLGTEIPIVSEEESRSMKPDYYLVLPWHFREEILQREEAMLARGTGLIFPLPNIDVVRR